MFPLLPTPLDEAPVARSEAVRTCSLLGVLRLKLGRFAVDTAPDLSSLRSSVGLGPRFHFDGEDETTDEVDTVIVRGIWLLVLLADLRPPTGGNERARSRVL